MTDLQFYNNKKVLITGHTGFKGTWLCTILVGLGAKVIGYALKPPTEPNLFSLSEIEKDIYSIEGDIRDLCHLKKVFDEFQPEIVIHLAAQPIVRDSYSNPVYTYETNVMGTVNLCECIRLNPCVKSFLNVTTDKVYENKEWEWGYRECDVLNGYDPYSNSKSCSELVTQSYIKSFFCENDIAVSTARAGNVIGGGDFANDRIIPDCVRAVKNGEEILVRNPYSIRPYQHVLEPLSAYLLIAKKQYEDRSMADFYNVGPNDEDCFTTGELVTKFCKEWGNDVSWNIYSNEGPHEANFLKLDCSKIRKRLGWRPNWNIDKTIKQTVAWTKVYLNNGNIKSEMEREIADYFKNVN